MKMDKDRNNKVLKNYRNYLFLIKGLRNTKF